MDISSVAEFITSFLESIKRVDFYSLFSDFIGNLGPLPLYSSISIILLFLVLLIFVKIQIIARNAPGILISLGILFTFIGITIALINFDPQDITRTIPELLEGLKLAFVSSVVGLFTSIFYRFWIIFWRFVGVIYRLIKRKLIKTDEISSDELTGKHFYEMIKNINESVKDLKEEFKNFSSEVTQQSTKALTESLKEIVENFNQNITEQFGENFRQFNNAVGELIKWQEENKKQVERLIELFKEAQQGIQLANQSINEIKESTSQIPEHMEKLRTAFDATNSRMEELYGGLEALANIRENAEQALPAIQKHLDTIFGELRSGMEEQRNIIQGLQQQVSDQIDVSIATMHEKVQEHLTAIAEGHQHGQQQHLQIIQQSEENLRDLQRSIQSNVNNIINNMGNQLTEITQEFITRYRQAIDPQERNNPNQ